MKNIFITFLLFLNTFSFAQTYKEQNYNIEERVEDLLKRMTLEEKVAQVHGMSLSVKILNNEFTGVKDPEYYTNFPNGIGSIENMNDSRSPEESAKFINQIQKHFIENTRLGIPVRVNVECLHGQNAFKSTVFPVPIAMASSWDTTLVNKVFSVIAKEARSRGSNAAHTPVLDIARDPRWGRVEETYGEDTYLTSRMGVAMIRALQGDGHLIGEDNIAATCKHFAGYGQGDGGRNFAPTYVTKRYLYDQILPPFKAAVIEAKVQGVMPSHAEIDGVPCHANTELLTDLLRNEWNFDGLVVADYGDIARLNYFMHVADDTEEAAIMGLKAGVDLDIPVGEAYKSLTEIIKNNPDIEKVLDQSVKRVLKSKFILGLFDDPYADPSKAQKVVNCQEHQDLALEAAEKSIILLKNDSVNDKPLLPLNFDDYRHIAVIGPNADPVQLGVYTYNNATGTSILEGIKKKTGNKLKVSYAQGCGITKMVPSGKGYNIPALYSMEEDKPLMEKAVGVAKKADLVIVCVGGDKNTSKEAVFAEKGYGDVASLDLPGQQDLLIKKILETGKPVVVILNHGRPYSINYIANNVPAILDTWFLGEKTGQAVANVLFGDVNPGGKLTVTIPRSVGHLPSYYSQKPTGKFKKYLFTDSSPLFPFGYGMSYTRFEFNNLKIKNKIFSTNSKTSVSFDVTNTGKVKGDEIVQMYIKDIKGSVTRPIMELKGFARIELIPGETKTVNFEITPDKLAFTDINYDWVVEPGEFELMIGSSSEDIRLRSAFEVK